MNQPRFHVYFIDQLYAAPVQERDAPWEEAHISRLFLQTRLDGTGCCPRANAISAQSQRIERNRAAALAKTSQEQIALNKKAALERLQNSSSATSSHDMSRTRVATTPSTATSPASTTAAASHSAASSQSSSSSTFVTLCLSTSIVIIRMRWFVTQS